MKVKPLNDRVLVLRIEEKEKTEGGIIIPDTAKEKPQEGKVVAVGPGKLSDKGERIPLDLKENDRVFFEKYAGSNIKIDGVEYLILREDDMLGVVQRSIRRIDHDCKRYQVQYDGKAEDDEGCGYPRKRCQGHPWPKGP
jgi:chaperonin GroES